MGKETVQTDPRIIKRKYAMDKSDTNGHGKRLIRYDLKLGIRVNSCEFM